MNRTLVYDKPSPFGDHLGDYGPHPIGGDHWHFKFANGYGASVVRFDVGMCHSYGGDHGKWELAVLDDKGELTYDTPITNDVIGWLSEEDVAATLASIAALPIHDDRIRDALVDFADRYAEDDR